MIKSKMPATISYITLKNGHCSQTITVP